MRTNAVYSTDALNNDPEHTDWKVLARQPDRPHCAGNKVAAIKALREGIKLNGGETPGLKESKDIVEEYQARVEAKASAPAHSEAFPNGSSVNLYQNRDGTYRIEYRPAPTIWNNLTLNEAMARLAPYIRDNARPYA